MEARGVSIETVTRLERDLKRAQTFTAYQEAGKATAGA